MSWYIDVEDANGVRLGSGPIERAVRWRSTLRMDRGGEFAFEMAATDAKAGLVQPGRVVRCHALVGGAWQEIGAGVVDRIELRPDGAGRVMLAVSGGDLVAALAHRSVLNWGFGLGGTPPTLATALGTVAANFMPAGWAVTVTGTPPIDAFYGKFSFDTTLAALRMMAERSQTHFYYSGPQALTFTATWPASGVRAVRAEATDLAAEVCAITELVRVDDSFELCNYLYAFGGGNGDARLTLRATTRTAAGLTLTHFPVTDGVTQFGEVSLLSDGASASLYGVRAQSVQWKEIYPLSSTAADVQAAANALFDQAERYLRQHTAPQRFFRLRVAGCARVLRPMQTIRVVYWEPDGNIEIDEDLRILEATTECEADGVATVELVVATVDRWPSSDAAELAGRLASGVIYQAHPQVDHNGYVISYSKSIDDVEEARFRFRFDQEVLRLIRCTFDFQLLPLESTVKSVGMSSTTTAASGDHSHTVEISDHSHTVTVPAHQHTVTILNHTHDVTVPAHQHTVTILNHTHDVPVPAHQHTVTIGDHTHSVSVSSHSHNVPNHQHRIGASQGSGGRNVGLFTGGGLYYEGADAGVVSLYTTSDSGGTTTNSGGSSTPTTSSGGGTTATSSSGGGTTATSSSGGGSTPTTSSGGGTTATSSSGGGTTATSSSGGGSTPTTSSGGGSTPTSASGGSHTHTVTPVVNMVYGIYRDSGANVFGLADLEYSVDGAVWFGFAVGVNGFTTLGDGWYRIDLTALLQEPVTFRPVSSNNALRVRRKAAGAVKKATIDGQLNIRTQIQALALT